MRLSIEMSGSQVGERLGVRRGRPTTPTMLQWHPMSSGLSRFPTGVPPVSLFAGHTPATPLPSSATSRMTFWSCAAVGS